MNLPAPDIVTDVSLEHLWLVVVAIILSWLLVTLTTWTSWASVVAAWATVASAVVTARTTLAVIATWAAVSAWLALRLNISFRLLDEGLA